jgi:hypothetical protein
MNALTKKIVLSALVLLLSACAYHPYRHGNYNGGYYPNNGPYYPGNRPYYQGYGNNYHRPYHHRHRPPANWGYGRPYGGYQSNNNYYQNNNYYNRPQPRPYPAPGYGYQRGNPGQHWGHPNRPPNWGWQGNNNRPQPRQPMLGHHGGGYPRAIANGRPNGGWQGQNRQPIPRPQPIAARPAGRPAPPVMANRQPNGGGFGRQGGFNRQPPVQGGWQRPNNQPQPRPRPVMAQPQNRPPQIARMNNQPMQAPNPAPARDPRRRGQNPAFNR